MADNNQYKIELGVKLDTSDLKTEINKIDGKHKVKLGVDLSVNDIRDRIKQYNTNTNNIKVKLKATLDTDDLKKQINKLDLSTSGKGVAIPVDTKSLEISLKEVKDIIADIKTTMGSLDGGDMKSLLSSVNQIATALGKAESESDSLIKSLNALSKKDLSVNFGFNMGKSASQVSSEQGDLKRNAISQLKQQAKALESYLDQYYKVAQQGEGVVKLIQGTNLFSSFWEMSPNIGNTKVSLKQQVDTYKQYINLMQEAAKIKDVDLSGVTSGFSKTTSDIVEETKKVSNGAEEIKQAFKGLLGDGIGAEQLSAQLEPIVGDLRLIQEAVTALSKDTSLGGLTASFNRLSNSIENLLANAERVKGVLNSGFDVGNVGGTSISSTSSSTITSAQQTSKKIGETVTKSVQQSLNLDDVIDKEVLSLMDKFEIAGGKGSKAFDEIRKAVVECRAELNTIKNGDFDIDEQAFGNSAAVDKVTDAIANQHRAVNGLGDEYVKLAEYMTRFNDPKKSNKVRLPDFVKQEQGDAYSSNRGSLGIAFNVKRGISFADFINDLNHELPGTINLTKGEAAAFDELVQKVKLGRQQLEALKKSNKSLTSTASTKEILEQNGISREEIYDDTISAINAIGVAEQKLVQSGSGFENVENNLKEVSVAAGSTTDAIKQMRDIMSSMEFDNPSIDAAAKDLEGLGLEISKIVMKDNDANLDITVTGVDTVGRAVTEIRRFDKETEQISSIGKTVSQTFETSADALKRTQKENASTIKEIKSEMSDFVKLQKQIGNLDIKIGTLEAQGGDADYIADLKRQLVDLENTYERSMQTFRQKLFDKETRSFFPFEDVVKFNDEINSVIQSTNNKLRELDIKVANEAELQEVTADFEKIKSLAKQISNLKIDILKSDNVSDISKMRTELDKLNSEYEELFAKTNGNFSNRQKSQLDNLVDQSDAKLLNEVNKQLNEFVKLQSRIENTQFEIGKLDVIGGKQNEIETLKRQFEEAGAAYQRLWQIFSDNIQTVGVRKFINVEEFSSLENGIEEATRNAGNRLERFKSQWADTRTELAKKIEIDLETGKFSIEVKKVENNIDRLSNVSNELRLKLDALKTAEGAMNSAFKNGTVDEKIKSWEDYKRVLKDVENQYKANKIVEDNINSVNKLNQQKHSLSLDMDNWLKNNSAAAKRFGSTIKELKVQLESCDDVEFGNIKNEFQNVKKEAESLGLTTRTLGDSIKTKFKEYMAYFSVAEVFMYAEQGLRSMFEQVKLIDSAMTELKKVTNETDDSYNQFLTNAADRAKAIGTTIDGLVSSTADFARLGYGFEDAQGLAEVANIYAVVGDEVEGVEGATESLISTMAAFKDEINGLSDSDFALNIVDKLNEVANNYSITSGGLGEALQRSASSLSTANNTLDESISLITAANEVVQNPEKVGNAMKTISMRIRSAKSEMEEMGEDTDGMVESTATLRAEIKALSGVDIMASATEFKSTYQILDELSQKWEDLNDISRATIIEKMAGKHQGNIFSSLMENFDTARSALETSLNSAGSAMAEHEKWQQSLEADDLPRRLEINDLEYI